MSMSLTTIGPLIAWCGCCLALTGWLGYSFLAGDERVFLPGDTTHGHYQIEMACNACHESGGGVNEQSCIDCHQQELDAAKDSHPKKKFKNIRKAHLLEEIDALACITCHQEHVPERTTAMGVSIQNDYCILCHENIAEERPTHQGAEFQSCATAGCHNYHDNSALYYEFLKKHAKDPDMAPQPVLPAKDFAKRWLAKHGPSLGITADGPKKYHAETDIHADWHETAHAKAGVNCTACHTNADGEWSDEVDHTNCASCHSKEVEGWLAGLHGMRVNAGLSPMTPGGARLSMHQNVHAEALDCNSCHSGHRFDTQYAAVDACLNCHNDTHSQNYMQSKHYQLWQKEVAGEAASGTGVSCASCHMPRITTQVGPGKTEVHVEHNQNLYLNPNEKMIRTSCQHCHGVGFTIDALADPELIKKNFSEPPQNHIPSIDWVLDHDKRTSRKPESP